MMRPISRWTAFVIGRGVFAALLLLPAVAASQGAAAQGVKPPPPPRPNMKVIRKLRVRFEREPTVREVQVAALRFFKVHPDRVAGYRAGAAWKAIVPDIEVTFNTDRGNNDRRLTDALYLNSPIVVPLNGNKEYENTTRTRRSGTLGSRSFDFQRRGPRCDLPRGCSRGAPTRDHLALFHASAAHDDHGSKSAERSRGADHRVDPSRRDIRKSRRPDRWLSYA